MRRHFVMAGLAASMVMIPSMAFADPNNSQLVCEPPEEVMDLHRLVRAWSLDVRGTIPTEAEYTAVEDGGMEAAETLLDEWLVSDAFADRVVRTHRDLLWNNVTDVTLVNTRGRIRATGGLWWRRSSQAIFYRGGNVGCRNVEATYDADGMLETVADANGYEQEGYVWVNPYWAPNTPVKVCAFDAQDALVSPLGTDCSTSAGGTDRGCGCGPELRHCSTAAIEREITAAFAMDVDLRVRAMVTGETSYVDLFDATSGYVNGPIVHYWKYLRTFQRMPMSPAPVDLEGLPDLPFDDKEFTLIDMGGHHAGILTSPAFLLRFQTDRARANRFYTSFLCQPFNAPNGGVPVADEHAQTEPDLQVRAGCDYCHALLEPAAAHWGRWGERGSAYLSPEDHPPFDESCHLCATAGLPCSARCRSFYTVATLDPKEDEFVGWMNAYYFRRAEHELYVEEGPEFLVYNTVVDGRFPTCVSETSTERLLGRPITVDEEPLVDEIAQKFVASGYSYREATRAVLTNDIYRRAR